MLTRAPHQTTSVNDLSLLQVLLQESLKALEQTLESVQGVRIKRGHQ